MCWYSELSLPGLDDDDCGTADAADSDNASGPSAGAGEEAAASVVALSTGECSSSGASARDKEVDALALAVALTSTEEDTVAASRRGTDAGIFMSTAPLEGADAVAKHADPDAASTTLR
mmetsp:Transcript_73384/g.162312  ORF Transcript_73384/g.162312 Transcript_73384/m.162312 type:complete len:119 (-) Transcript_73384:20-376(-)